MRRGPVLVFVALAAVVGAACGDGEGDGGALSGIEGVVVESVEGRDHVEGDLDYPDSPPSGGDHDPVWQNCGFYDAPVSDEKAVHALEHGVVWLAYSPDLAEADIEVVRELFEFADGRAIASPYPGVDVLEVVAWRHRLIVDDMNDERVRDLIEAARPGDHAPEPGATCQGGVSDVSDTGQP